MEICVYCIGKLSKHSAAMFLEYAERIQHYCRFRVLEIAEPKGKFRSGREAAARASLELKQRLEGFSYTVFDREGKMMTSEEFAGWLDGHRLHGQKTLRFVIGGADGLDEEFLAGADMRISFSALTFPHQLFRVMLAEQIYRGFTLLEGHPYHK